MKKSLSSLVLIVTPIFFAILVSIILQSTILSNQEKYISWLSSFGPVFILVYVLIQITTIIIAPLGGFFIQIGVLALLPPIQAVLLIYLVTTPAFLINYFLAHRYGRPLITRLIGSNAMEKVDEYVKDVGIPMLIVMKLFQSGLFDYVSYAVGLTKIPFTTFALINIIGGIPAVIVQYLIFSKFSNFTQAVTILIVLSYGFFGGALLLLHAYRNKQKIIHESTKMQ